MLRKTTIVLFIFVTGLLAFADETAQAGGMTFEVNQPEDAVVGDGDGTCDATCTLRDAIMAANANPGHDTIVFDPTVFAPGSGNDNIILSPLPVIDAGEGITIDGTGAEVFIYGFETFGDGLVFTSGVGQLLHDVTVRNLSISHYSRGIAVCPGMVSGECTYNASNILLEDVATSENSAIGIEIVGVNISDVALTRIRVDNSGEQGVSVEANGDASQVSIVESVFSGNNLQAAQIRAFDGFVLDALVRDNMFTSNLGGQSLYITSEASQGVEVAGNTISGAPQQGIYMSGSGSDFHVHENTVQPGTQGIVIFGPGGPNFRILDNTVTGGSGESIVMFLQSPGTGIQVAGNVVLNGGSDDHAGIRLGALNSPAAPYLVRNNEVSGSGGDGIEITDAARATITQNKTYNNGELGIDLVASSDTPPGVTFNDAGDGDTGPNGLLNFPEWEGGADACPHCRIEIFLSDNDPSGFGEGMEFLAEVMADGTGDFLAELCVLGLAPGTKITATATDPAGNTSEFSPNYPWQGSEPCPTPTPTPSPTAPASPSPTATATPTPTPTPTGGPTATPTSSPGPGELTWGDHNCSGDADPVDALLTLRHDAGLETETGECPEFGTAIPAGGPALVWGDVDCNGTIDPVDGLKLLRHDAGLSVQQEEGCPEIGEPLP